jgi:hypothetical protein
MDLLGCIRALLGDWLALLSAVLTFASLIKRLRDHPRYKVAIWVAAFGCLMISFVRIWTAQERRAQRAEARADALSLPQLSITIGQSDVGTQHGLPVLLLWASISNRGAPTIINLYSVLARFPNGSSVAGQLAVVPPTLTFAGYTQRVRLRALYDKTAENPIPHGGGAAGVLMFSLPRSVPFAAYIQKGTEYELTCHDINGKAWSASIKMSGQKGRFHYVPGTGVQY